MLPTGTSHIIRSNPSSTRILLSPQMTMHTSSNIPCLLLQMRRTAKLDVQQYASTQSAEVGFARTAGDVSEIGRGVVCRGGDEGGGGALREEGGADNFV